MMKVGQIMKKRWRSFKKLYEPQRCICDKIEI